MKVCQLAPGFSVAPQLTADDVAEAARLGFRAIIANRPDGEEPTQPRAAEIAEMAAKNGMGFAHVPVVASAIGEADITRMKEALAAFGAPVLAYCRSGTRAAMLWALTEAGRADPDSLIGAAQGAGYDLSGLKPRLAARASGQPGRAARGAARYDVVIVGGGSAGIATAASLLKRRPNLSIGIVEPATTHDYQPGWTLVGAGVFAPEATRRPMQAVMPDRVTWIRQGAAGFAPESDEVILADGSAVSYRVLVAAPGIKLDWDAIPGLAEALGRNGVTSNYRYDLAPYTRDLVRGLTRGTALFSQPPMPIKCAGAPQKAMYLSCDAWRRSGALPNIGVEFHNAGAVLFGVPAYVPALMSYIARYDVDLKLQSRLIAVDGLRREATFERKDADGTAIRTTRAFDMLHAVPPQVAPDVVAQSPLAGESGFIAVDQATLRHVRYANVFSLGDACSAPNAKTAAAARQQAPVVAVNVLATLDGRPLPASYNGYGSCPLTVELGRIVLAEFGYGGTLLPTFPSWLLDGGKATRAAWILKRRLLPPIYWQGMLKGREWFARPKLTVTP